MRRENLTLKVALRRTQDERYILKKAAAYFPKTRGEVCVYLRALKSVRNTGDLLAVEGLA